MCYIRLAVSKLCVAADLGVAAATGAAAGGEGGPPGDPRLAAGTRPSGGQL